MVLLKVMSVVDICSGLGGWSDGFALEGFNCLGVEINPKVAKMYKHDVVVMDVKTLDGHRLKDFDVIVGSPPCRDFSVLTYLSNHLHWKRPPDPEKGLELVHAFLRIVEEANPRYWLMENVPNLQKWLPLKPTVSRARLSPTMTRTFWGRFPTFLIPQSNKPPLIGHRSKDPKKRGWSPYTGAFKSWERARIPLSVSRALARAIREDMSHDPPSPPFPLERPTATYI